MKKPLLFGIILTVCVIIVAFVFSLGYPGGMISYWKFDEGSGTTASDSVDANDGTLITVINDPGWTTGQVGGALSFDGLDDYVTVPSNGLSSNPMTISWWMNTNDMSAVLFIDKNNWSATKGMEIWLYENDAGYGYLNVRGSGSTNVASSSDFHGEWVHVAVVFDGTTVKIYRNGAFDTSGPIGLITTSTEDFIMGMLPGVPGWYLDGILDEVAIYNRALSEEEINQHYENGLNGLGYEVECIPPPSGMVSWWPGEYNADDIVANNDGTVYDATYADGKVGQAFSFDGVDDKVEVLDDPTLDITDSITLEAWIKADSTQTGNAAGIITKDDLYSDGRSYNLHLSSASSPTPWALRMRLLTPNTLNNDGIIDGTTDLRDNTWHHVAGTWDGSIMNLYVDGILQNSRSCTGSIYISPTPVIIGDFGSSRYGQYGFNGLIDEVEIFNRALTASEIQDIYNAGSAGKCKYIEVDIDIKPGSDPNSINLSSAGVIPVAILSSETFDATKVDPETVTLAGAAVKMVGKSSKYLSHKDYVNDDDLLDLVCQILTEGLNIEPGDSVAVMEAETFDGQSIRGEDIVCIVKDN